MSEYDKLVAIVNEDILCLNQNQTEENLHNYLSDKEALCNIAEDLYDGHIFLFGLIDLSDEALAYVRAHL